MVILLIDDDEAFRFILSTMLEDEKHEVVEAPNGVVAAEMFRKKPADIIITDIFMPEKDGIETIMELKSYSQKVKIIAISGGGGRGNLDYLEYAKNFGADAILKKPFKQEALLQAIKMLSKDL